MKSKNVVANLLLLLFLLSLSSIASAAPISVGGPLSISGNGVNSNWVNTSFSPHNVESAISALALNPGNSGYISEVNQVVTRIDFADSNYQGYVAGYVADPMTPDDSFAVRYSGYINIGATDTYTFNAYTDDGFRLNIGGEMVGQYNADRSPGSSVFSVNLAAGLYAFEMIGWEQGGVFVNELSWHNSNATSWSLVSSNVLFTDIPSTPVPEPATLFLLTSGLLGFFGFKKKKN